MAEDSGWVVSGTTVDVAVFGILVVMFEGV